MSVCFMFTTAPQPVLTDERKAAVKELIQTIPDSELQEIDEIYGAVEEPRSADELRAELFQSIVSCCELDGGDSATLQMPGMDWKAVITGGMSYGDSPSDSFEIVAMASRFPCIENLLMQFAREDHHNASAAG